MTFMKEHPKISLIIIVVALMLGILLYRQCEKNKPIGEKTAPQSAPIPANAPAKDEALVPVPATPPATDPVPPAAANTDPVPIPRPKPPVPTE